MSRCALLVAVGAGCAGAEKPIKFAGDARGRACMEALPSLDIADSELTPEMRMARMLSAESLELPAPVVPTDKRAAELSSWSDRELKTWLSEKQKRAEAARQELDRAAQQNHRQRIVAGALVGLVYEDLARTLLLVPPPSELDSEPEIAEVFREIMVKQAEPYLRHAKLAYTACAGNADGLATMGHWGQFCSVRGESLPQAENAPTSLVVQTTAAR